LKERVRVAETSSCHHLKQIDIMNKISISSGKAWGKLEGEGNVAELEEKRRVPKERLTSPNQEKPQGELSRGDQRGDLIHRKRGD